MNNKILIVEDEQPILDLLGEKFTKEGFIVSTARSGKSGLDSALKDHPDLILLDIVMPVMDGMEMLERLRKDPWGKSVQVILLTNLTDTNKAIQSTQQGVTDYWIKCDMTMEEVVERVKKKLAKK